MSVPFNHLVHDLVVSVVTVAPLPQYCGFFLTSLLHSLNFLNSAFMRTANRNKRIARLADVCN